MVTNSVCAVVVSFHPDEAVIENLHKLSSQVQGLVIVDNGSSPEELALLRNAASYITFELIENGDNLGIATALNIGICWAERAAFRWVILFDQDSTVTDGFIATMLRAFEVNPHADRLALLVPRYIDKSTGSSLSATLLETGGLETSITSGSLMLVSTFRQNGPFEEDLFIDHVDDDYSLRLRSNGYIIEECRDAILLHEPGIPHIYKFLGIYLFTTTNYSPFRRYYQQRNRIWIIRKYWRRFPGFCLKTFGVGVKELAKILFAENNKWQKCHYFSMGIADGLRGRMGKLNRP